MEPMREPSTALREALRRAIREQLGTSPVDDAKLEELRQSLLYVLRATPALPGAMAADQQNRAQVATELDSVLNEFRHRH
ncbi:hypothetical protein HMPREF9946_02178 [Acetobacteraceae bacterium AT-5844]|nr:hypothetical protein HMPREF9946_02178 [Acetobacteraceae bacterium AT-5844]